MNPTEGIDTIGDFVVADDVFSCNPWFFTGGLTSGVLQADQVRIGTSAQDSSDRFIYNQAIGAIYFDSDGVGGVAQIQLARLSAGLAITHQIFYIELAIG